MLDDIKMRFTSASTQREALERERETADPTRLAALDAELHQVREAEATARRELADAGVPVDQQATIDSVAAAVEAAEANGFAAPTDAGGTIAGPDDEAARKAAEQAQEAPAGPSNVQTHVVNRGHRIGGMAARGDRIIDVVTHPDIVEARLANARTEAVREKLAQEQAEKDKEQARAAERAEKDRDRAARIFEGGHDRGLGTADYLKIEADHRSETVNYADNAAALQEREQAEQATLAELTTDTGIEHVAIEPDTLIEGEIIADTVEVKGERYYTVEFTDDHGNARRTLIPSAGHDYQPGDEIQIERVGNGYEIGESYSYGR